MRSRSVLALALAATTACATVPRPEGPIPVAPDHRVRVTLVSRVALGPVHGTVVSLSPDTLVVEREEGGERRLSRSQVDEVEVSVTRVRDPASAAGYGILAGAPLLVPLLLLAFLGPYESGAAGVTFLVLPVAALATIGVIMGGGPQDVWVDAIWPSTVESAPVDSVSPETD